MRISAILTILSLLALPAFAAEDTSPVAPPSCANATPVPASDTLSKQDWHGLGFEALDAQLMATGVDACPTVTSCTEFSGCMDSDVCRTVNTGNACCAKGGNVLCCIIGTIHVTRCACTAECDPFCDPCPLNVVRSFRCQ